MGPQYTHQGVALHQATHVASRGYIFHSGVVYMLHSYVSILAASEGSLGEKVPTAVDAVVYQYKTGHTRARILGYNTLTCSSSVPGIG